MRKGGAASMAHIDRRNRGGTIRYVARYIDPAGRERSKPGSTAGRG
jgi:hypothetical protein